MVDCPNCNRFYNDDFNFCPYCGTEKPAPKICPNCEISTYESFMFCPKCGTELINEWKYNEALGYIENFIENGEYDAAIPKCKEINIEKKYEQKIELRKIIDDADLDHDSEYRLINKIMNNQITDENKLNREINSEKKKSELRKIVYDADIDHNSEYRLINDINYNQITDINQLNREINSEKMKPELRKIVYDAELDSKLSEKIFIDKINNNQILSEIVLNDVMHVEKRKSDLRKIAKKADLTSFTKSKLIDQINKNFIINVSTLEMKINKEERREKLLLENPNIRQCPVCKKPVNRFVDKCPDCGHYF